MLVERFDSDTRDIFLLGLRGNTYTRCHSESSIARHIFLARLRGKPQYPVLLDNVIFSYCAINCVYDNTPHLVSLKWPHSQEYNHAFRSLSPSLSSSCKRFLSSVLSIRELGLHQPCLNNTVQTEDTETEPNTLVGQIRCTTQRSTSAHPICLAMNCGDTNTPIRLDFHL